MDLIIIWAPYLAIIIFLIALLKIKNTKTKIIVHSFAFCLYFIPALFFLGRNKMYDGLIAFMLLGGGASYHLITFLLSVAILYFKKKYEKKNKQKEAIDNADNESEDIEEILK